MGKNKPNKLVLNRETVRDLTSKELDAIAGAKDVSAGYPGPCLSVKAPC